MSDLYSLYKRWNIKIDQNASLFMFKNRILNLIDDLPSLFQGHVFSIIKIFSDYAGVQSPYHGEYDYLLETQKFISFFHPFFSSITDSSQIFFYLQLLINAIYESLVERERYPDKKKNNKSIFLMIVYRIKVIFDMSSGIDVEINISENAATIFPSGVRLLDEELVNNNLNWLQDYPDVIKDYETALQIYLSKDKKKYRNLLDNLRFALEQLIRKILNNRKSLENQKDTLIPWLVSKNVNQQIIDMYIQLLFGQYSLYQNNAVKHNSAFSEEDIEFMIYLTSTFMRFLIKLVGIQDI